LPSDFSQSMRNRSASVMSPRAIRAANSGSQASGVDAPVNQNGFAAASASGSLR
jgi:hypothetical protein